MALSGLAMPHFRHLLPRFAIESVLASLNHYHPSSFSSTRMLTEDGVVRAVPCIKNRRGSEKISSLAFFIRESFVCVTDKE
jgi:hypothetical protein